MYYHMTRLFTVMIMISLWCVVPTHAQERYLSGVADIPLAAGLHELDNGRLIFDTPAGRIIQIAAIHDVSIDVIADFYRTTLPNLGWHEQTQPAKAAQPHWVFSFIRDGETLRLTLYHDLAIFDVMPSQ